LGLPGYPLGGFEDGTKVALRILLNIAVFFEIEIFIVPKMISILTYNIFLPWVLLKNGFP
jgi:hypothetical protein